MFGSRYFGQSYFGSSYFGQGSEESAREVSWSSTDKDSNAILSNSGLRVEHASNNVWASVRATTGRSAGKFYIEYTNTWTGNTYWQGVGFANSSLPTANWAGYTVGSIGLYVPANGSPSELLTNNITTLGTGGNWSPSDTICFAIDIDAKLIWWRVNGGSWNAGSPSTNTSGIDISAFIDVSPVVYPIASLHNASHVNNVRFRNRDFLYKIPKGFDSWATPERESIWNPAYSTPNAALSNGYYTVSSNTQTSGDVTGRAMVRSTTGYSSGKYYIEHTFNSANTSGYDSIIGLGNANVPYDTANNGWYLENFLGFDANSSIGHYLTSSGSHGKIHLNQATIADGLTASVGDVICLATDIGTKQAWFRVNGGNWNNNSSADPSSNAGGLSYTQISGSKIYAFAENFRYTASTPETVTTTNFGQRPFAQTIPSGFSAWGDAGPQTRGSRTSSVWPLEPWRNSFVGPSGTIGADDRAAIALVYSDFWADSLSYIVGTTTLTFGSLSDLNGTGLINATSTLVFSQAASLYGSGALGGNSTLVFDSSGTLVGAGALYGNSELIFAGTGTLVGAGVLSGNSTIVFGASGDMMAIAAIIGSSLITFDGSGNLVGAGAASGTSSLTFDLNLINNMRIVSGQSDLVFDGQGILIGNAAVTATTSLVFGQDGILVGRGSMVGSSDLTFVPLANLFGIGAVSGSSLLTFDQSGIIRGSGLLVGNSEIIFSPAAVISGSGMLVGDSTLVFDGAGNLIGIGLIGGTSAIMFDPSGSMVGMTSMDGSTSITFDGAAVGVAVGFVDGVASLIFTANGTVVGSTQLTGETSIEFFLDGDLLGVGSLDGDSNITFGLTGEMYNSSDVGLIEFIKLLRRENQFRTTLVEDGVLPVKVVRRPSQFDVDLKEINTDDLVVSRIRRPIKFSTTRTST